jgi:poly(beta-D-mannuronate) lyase
MGGMTRFAALLLFVSCAHATPVESPVGATDLACGRKVAVADNAALGPALAGAQAGDCLDLAAGEYAFDVQGKHGRADAPIVIRGKATVSRQGLTVASSSYVVLEGLDYSAGTSLRFVDCDHCRLTRSRLHPAAVEGLEWVVVDGRSDGVRIDHNDFGPYDVMGNMIQLLGASGQIVQNTRIDHNLFHDRQYRRGNGWETIRAGLSGFGLSSAHTTIEYNLFRACAGDPEIVSVKSSDNVVRFNTFRGSKGQLVLRHGNRDEVYGNWLIGLGLPGTGGIRVLGKDHRIFDNSVVDVAGPPLILQGAVSDAEENGRLQYQVHRAQVVHNTFVGEVGVKFGDDRPFSPVDSVFTNNIVEAAKEPLIDDRTKGIRLAGNVVRLRKQGEISTAEAPADAGARPSKQPLTEADVGPEAP